MVDMLWFDCFHHNSENMDLFSLTGSHVQSLTGSGCTPKRAPKRWRGGGRLQCLTGRPPIGVNQRKITFIIQSGEFILLEYTPYIPVELFFQGKFPASPTVIVTAEHYRSGLKHDATSVWLEDVSASSFKICLREFQNFAGVHDDISVVSIEI